MKLLVFAHRGEAQSFFKEERLKSHALMNELYLGSTFHLLLTGEGLYPSFIKLSKALALLPEVTNVINLGICGSFNKSLIKNQVLEVDIVYAQDEFKSFPLKIFNSKAMSCITSKQRVLKIEQSQHLSNIAPVVDRELWAQASVCKESNISLSSIKVISDHISDAQVCEFIKDEAEVFSDILLKYFLSIGKNNTVKPATSLSILENENFYFTLNQERSLHSLMEIIFKQDSNNDEESVLLKCEVSKIIKKDISAKNRSKLLLEKLNILAYPLKHIIREELEDISTNFKKIGINLKFDETLEKNGFDIQATINDKETLERTIKALEYFPWKKLEDIQSGQIFSKQRPISDK